MSKAVDKSYGNTSLSFLAPVSVPALNSLECSTHCQTDCAHSTSSRTCWLTSRSGKKRDEVRHDWRRRHHSTETSCVSDTFLGCHWRWISSCDAQAVEDLNICEHDILSLRKTGQNFIHRAFSPLVQVELTKPTPTSWIKVSCRLVLSWFFFLLFFCHHQQQKKVHKPHKVPERQFPLLETIQATTPGDSRNGLSLFDCRFCL